MTDAEKVEQLLATLERLEKAGTLQEFLKEATEVPREELWRSTVIPPVSKGFKEMHDFCMVALSLRLSEMERAMAWANYYANYCKNIYDGYDANRENIKNPEILRFIKDYEEYYMIREKEGKDTFYCECDEMLKEEEWKKTNI